jgi:DNA invertase Pin-like site-specific DNA recombinase
MKTIIAGLYLLASTANKTKRGETSTFDQDSFVQEQRLRDLIAQRHGQVYAVFQDRASGASERRPGLDSLMAAARRGCFNTVVVWRFDRFGRSVKQLVLALEEFRALGIDFISHQEALDTSTPMGEAMFTIIAAMAELERGVIRERMVAGLRYAQKHGTRSGNPIGRPRAVFDRDEVRHLRAQGWSWPKIGRKLGISPSTLRRACQNPPEPS